MSPNIAFLIGMATGGVLVFWGYPMAIAIYCEMTNKDLEDME